MGTPPQRKQPCAGLPIVLTACGDPRDHEVLDRVLRDWDLPAVHCSSFAEAGEALRSQIALVIFCDLRAGESGFEELLRLIQAGPQTRVVVLVPEDMDESVSRAVMQMGAFNVIVSPCQRCDVQWTILFALRESAADDK